MSSPKFNLTIDRDGNNPGGYTWSPFVTKLEARLRFSQLPYTTRVGSLSESPKGNVPYLRVEDGETGQGSLISDSTLIIRNLIERGNIEDLNANLSNSQKALDLSLRALLEDKLYFMSVR